MREIKTVIVELEYPRDDCLRDCSDEYYGIGRELIRCRDCKHNRTARCPMYTEQYSTGYGFAVDVRNEPDDFCSLAEPTLSRLETALSEERKRRMIK